MRMFFFASRIDMWKDFSTFTKNLENKEYCEENHIKLWEWILHDQDRYTLADENRAKKGDPDSTVKAGNVKAPHAHFRIEFEIPVRFSAVAKLTGLPINMIQKCKNKLEAICYLTHLHSPEKHQYSDSEVHANWDWITWRDQKLTASTQKNARKKKHENDDLVEEIVDKIGKGEIHKFQLSRYLPFTVQTMYNSQLETAFKLYAGKFLDGGVQRPEENPKTLIYIQGSAGRGKSTLAKKLAGDILQNEKYKKAKIKSTDFSLVTSDDALGNYRGQPIMILDDFRPGGLKPKDLLTLTDPYTNSALTSRYSDQVFFGDIIIITSVLNAKDFFSKSAEKVGNDEPVDQFLRRIGQLYEVNVDDIVQYEHKKNSQTEFEMKKRWKNVYANRVARPSESLAIDLDPKGLELLSSSEEKQFRQEKEKETLEEKYQRKLSEVEKKANERTETYRVEASRRIKKLKEEIDILKKRKNVVDLENYKNNDALI